VFVIIFGFLVMVQNFGINVMSLLAGLGLGGLAVALAAQDTCANFFGSVMILLDRPFRIGDIINVANIEGTVEDVGFRSTKIRTFYGSLITVPNAEMAKSHIDNLGVRKQRRVRFHLGVEYSTKPDSMKKFIEGVKTIIAANSLSDKDNITVAFDSYGDFSLNILLNFFLNVQDIKGELVEKEKILLEIYALADSLNVGFAFPTQTIHLSKSQE
ncbi:MAG: mechanosensitive ion channel, partial [Bdellovibrionales bacterium]|nr:mechanosensitive ion channel [Bdellovibrionales bacterium]